MATFSQDRHKTDDLSAVTYAVDPTLVINHGDFVYWDAAVKYAKAMTVATQGRLCLGVAEGQIPIASNVDNVTGLENRIRVRTGKLHRHKATNGETYNHGDALVLGADAQTLRLYNAGGGDVVGDIIAYAFLPIAGTVVAGPTTEIDVLVRATFPAIGLQN